MLIKTIFNGMNRSLRGGHFILWIASGQVVKGRTGSQRMVQESVALRVTYERKIANWKKLTDTVTNFIAKDSLPVECSTLPT